MFSCNHENSWSATHWLNYPKLMYINIYSNYITYIYIRSR
jgi:hypothetical protein